MGGGLATDPGYIAGFGFSPMASFDKRQKAQAEKDRIRLGTYAYNDTLRELWEGTEFEEPD